MTCAILASNLSKLYNVGLRQRGYRTLRESLADACLVPLRKAKQLLTKNADQAEQDSKESTDFWALRDVAFTISSGEVVGIIGRNGAGKSTLLKILSRITEPTTGQIELRGRVGSLLEVGTGFHPELTGRENVYMNGSILGMSRREISRKFDEIVAFAEIDDFLDTPVKRYSSGMYVRLAFAVAAHLEPEILIVDEVLAVGDAEFQKKCIGKMQTVAAHGRTVLFVSHNMSAVTRLCKRSIWLEGGRVKQEGSSAQVVSNYLGGKSGNSRERNFEEATAPGNAYGKLRKVSIAPQGGTVADPISITTPVAVTTEYWNYRDGANLNVSVVVANAEGLPVFNSFPNRSDYQTCRDLSAGIYRSTCSIPANLLNDGRHFLHVLLVSNQTQPLLDEENVLSFEVLDAVERRDLWHGPIPGAVRPDLPWSTLRLSALTTH